jgi:hypothetical protein
MRADGIPPQHGLRQTELQQLQEVVNRLESKLEALPDRRKHGGSTLQEAFTALPTPEAGVTYPVAWRTLTPGQHWLRWKDLALWVDWIIDTYRLPPRTWAAWWTAPGVCEELACLRAWHRELVDIHIPGSQMPEKPWDPEARVQWLQQERAHRLEWARGHVEWHDALWRVAQRVGGIDAELKPLLTRESESTILTGVRRHDEATARGTEFRKWLTTEFAAWAMRPQSSHDKRSLGRVPPCTRPRPGDGQGEARPKRT